MVFKINRETTVFRDVDGPCVELWLERIGQGLSNRTVNHARGLLSTVFRSALRFGVLCDRHSNPVLRSEKRKCDQVSFGWLRPDEVDRFLDAVPIRWRCAFALATLAGLRKGEVLALRRRDVDASNATISVQRSWKREATKNGKHRVVPIADRLLPLLKERCDGAEGDDLASGCASSDALLFPSLSPRCRGRMLTEDVDLGAVLRKALIDSRLDHRSPMRFHDLRHSFGSILVARGVPLKVVSRMMGHSSVTVTERIYIHLDADGSMKAVRGALSAP